MEPEDPDTTAPERMVYGDDSPTIVLAVDDDDASFVAAGAITRWFTEDARVVALHVADPAAVAPTAAVADPAYESVAGYPWRPPSAFASDAEALQRGRELARRAAAIAGGEPRVEEGGAARMIIAVAEAVDADVIVVGSGDRSWLSRLLEPSVSAHLVHHAPCSVLVVRDQHRT